MLRVVVLFFLFNITYTSTRPNLAVSGLSDNSPPLAYHGIEGKKVAQNSDKNKNILNNQNDGHQSDLDEPAVLKLSKDPFGDAPVVKSQAQKSNSENVPQNQEKIDLKIPSKNKKPNIEENVVDNPSSKSVAPSVHVKQTATNNTNEIKIAKKDSSLIPVQPNIKEDIIQSGALLRGFYVFLGLSVITVIYFLFRSYRLRHGSQPSTTVRKYGVTARRSDMEMRPLELDEDDDDTVFEIGNEQTANR